MAQETIFLPVLALAALTFLVLLFIPLRRFRAVAAGHVTAADFALGESANVPPNVSLPNRDYMNLLAVNLAWAYVALRAVHSLVHISVNHVIARLSLFAISNFVLIALWVVFGMRVTAA